MLQISTPTYVVHLHGTPTHKLAKFLLKFLTPSTANKFWEYLSSKHPNIKFSIEKKEDGCLPFLNINIFREKEKFATNVYRKKTFSGVIPTSKVLYPKHRKLV